MDEELQQSYILIQFAEFGSVLFKPTFENLSPFQILAVAHFLEDEGKALLQQHRIQEMQKAQMQQIAIPGTPQVNLDKTL